MFGGGCQQKKGRYFYCCNGRAKLENCENFFNYFKLLKYFFMPFRLTFKKFNSFLYLRFGRDIWYKKLSWRERAQAGRQSEDLGMDILRHVQAAGMLSKAARAQGSRLCRRVQNFAAGCGQPARKAAPLFRIAVTYKGHGGPCLPRAVANGHPAALRRNTRPEGLKSRGARARHMGQKTRARGKTVRRAPHCTVSAACVLATLRPASERRSARSRAPGVSRHWAKSLRHAPNSRKL